MIMLDKWEKLEADERLDQDLVKTCKELAFAMCAKIFETFGMDVLTDGECLVATGRGLRHVFQVGSKPVLVKELDVSRLRPLSSSIVTRSKKGRSPKVRGD